MANIFQQGRKKGHDLRPGWRVMALFWMRDRGCAPPAVDAGGKGGQMAEVESVGGLVSVVAQRHVFSKGLLYNWRSAGGGGRAVPPAEFVQLGVVCIGPGPDDANDDWRDSPRVTGLALAVLDADTVLVACVRAQPCWPRCSRQ